MAGILKPDESLLWRGDCLLVLPDHRSRAERVVPSFKEKDRRAQVQTRLAEINTPHLRHQNFEREGLAMNEAEVIRERILRRGDHVRQDSSNVREIRPAGREA